MRWAIAIAFSLLVVGGAEAGTRTSPCVIPMTLVKFSPGWRDPIAAKEIYNANLRFNCLVWANEAQKPYAAILDDEPGPKPIGLGLVAKMNPKKRLAYIDEDGLKQVFEGKTWEEAYLAMGDWLVVYYSRANIDKREALKKRKR